jgi:hypothetical protein
MTELSQNALTAKRVGQYLIDAGVLRAEQLDEALDRQKRMSRAGFHVLLGTILEEMGAIDRQSLEAIILRQRLDEGSVNLGAEADWASLRAEAPIAHDLNVVTPDQPISGQESHSSEQSLGSQTSEDTAAAEPNPEDLAEFFGEPVEDVLEAVSNEPMVELELVEEVVEFHVEAQSDLDEESVFNDPEFSLSEPESEATETNPTEEEQMTQTASTPTYDAGATWGRVEFHGFSFSRVSDGLDETEVNAALDQLSKHTKTVEEQLAEAKETAAHMESMRRYGEETIKAADLIASQVRAEAEQQAAAIRERAQQEAQTIIAEARVRHDDLLKEATAHAQRVVAEVSKHVEEHRQVSERLIESANRLSQEGPHSS